MKLVNHKLKKLQILIFIALIISSCDDFEEKFFKKIDQGQINAIKNGSDKFNLSSITDFQWDSVFYISTRSSVEIPKKTIVEEFKYKFGSSQISKYEITNLPGDRARFYFLNKKKELIIKEIDAGDAHYPWYELEYCLKDSINEKSWLTKKECIFTIISGSRYPKAGTIYLFPNCKTKYSPEIFKAK